MGISRNLVVRTGINGEGGTGQRRTGIGAGSGERRAESVDQKLRNSEAMRQMKCG